jgi:hypothetical protein
MVGLGGANGKGEKVLESSFRAEDGERMPKLRTSGHTDMKKLRTEIRRHGKER